MTDNNTSKAEKQANARWVTIDELRELYPINNDRKAVHEYVPQIDYYQYLESIHKQIPTNQRQCQLIDPNRT